MASITSTGAIKDKAGSNLWTLWEVDDTFAAVTPFTCYGIGSIKETTQEQSTSVTKYKNESGNVEASDKDYEISLKGVIMDTSKALIDYLSTTVKGKFYGLYRRRNSVDGKTQEWFYGFGEVTPQHNVKSPGGADSMPFEYIALNNSSAITLSTTTLASIGAYVTAAVTIPIAGIFTIVETA
jgi:hypothetical protein